MSVKDFKFVSPGVFINEIDNSFIPTSPEAIGPLVVGRATRGLAMQPVKVESYSQFVEMFGDTVAGGSGVDVWRDGDTQSPMYGTYAAKAFLHSNVAPLNYLRLLGQQTSIGSANAASVPAGAAGWKTSNNPNISPPSNGGAYGLFLFTSGAATQANIGTGSLAAIFYVEAGDLFLSGNVYGGAILDAAAGGNLLQATGANGTVIGRDSNDLFTLVLSGSPGQMTEKKYTFTLDDTNANYIRNVFNTNPTKASSAGTFYASDSAQSYWLGQTFDQTIRDRALHTGSLGAVFALWKGSSSEGPNALKAQASNEAKAGWFIGQDLGQPAAFVAENAPKLFRFIGRGHGAWLQKNCKVSIANIRRSSTNTDAYGTFSVIIRNIHDTDAKVEVMERYDNCNLDPSSPNYLGRKIGDKYQTWDTTEKRLKTYGDYDNKSKFVYVEMASDVEGGATDASLLPFGYFGPPRFSTIFNLQGSGSFTTGSFPGEINPQGSLTPGTNDYSVELSLTNYFLTGGMGIPHTSGAAAMPAGTILVPAYAGTYLSGGWGISGKGVASCTGSLEMPTVRLRLSASDGGLTNPEDAFFGMQTTRTETSSRPDGSVVDYHNILYSGYTAGGGDAAWHNTSGVDNFSYVFTLNDIVYKASGTSQGFYYSSGSHTNEQSYSSASYTDLLASGIQAFTAPFFGGFDGFDITKPDPLYNNAMSTTSTEDNNYVYHTWKRAIDTVADPEYINMNLFATPGLTQNQLTEDAMDMCGARGDALALIDLPDVYVPPQEAYYSDKADRLRSTPTATATALRDRFIDTSYGATFYPWVQTRDAPTGRLLWIPPSVAMMGVLASSERASELWFAPAGFNRGGLSEGAAGIPVSNVLMRLTSKERDTLYDTNINPIASFPSSGIVVFGQKTLQARRSALDRINVRRLVIYLKKQISILSTQVLFDQNVEATWERFKALINPLLSSVQSRFGITEYRLILDSSTTTPDLIDQNIMYAKIMVKPARAIEFIAIDFVIASTGASFDD